MEPAAAEQVVEPGKSADVEVVEAEPSAGQVAEQVVEAEPSGLGNVSEPVVEPTAAEMEAGAPSDAGAGVPAPNDESAAINEGTGQVGKKTESGLADGDEDDENGARKDRQGPVRDDVDEDEAELEKIKSEIKEALAKLERSGVE